ncbi:NAD(P)H-binding protein [Sorangium sp. So ce448]|uniref:SDR family oxidoreductase n=1 Tax=Sorangium sp. So ce448 TaxID=3133314 RepID=UPI003F61AD99
MEEAVRGCEAVFNCVHTLSPQKGAAPGETFVDTELRGLENVVAACRIHGVRRVLYVTFLGITPDTRSIWARGRWKAEQMLLGSGRDVTILRPGQIVGRGGFDFDTTLANARRRVALILGGGRNRMQNIALDDLVHYLVRSLDEPRTFGRAFDVGGDEAFTTDEMVDVAARVLGRRPPWKLHLLPWLPAPFAGLFERLAGLPRGAFADLLLGLDADLVGDVGPIRALIPLTPMATRRPSSGRSRTEHLRGRPGPRAARYAASRPTTPAGSSIRRQRGLCSDRACRDGISILRVPGAKPGRFPGEASSPPRRSRSSTAQGRSRDPM